MRDPFQDLARGVYIVNTLSASTRKAFLFYIGLIERQYSRSARRADYSQRVERHLPSVEIFSADKSVALSARKEV